MPVQGHSFKTEHLGTGQIETLEIAMEENLMKMRGAIGWGSLGDWHYQMGTIMEAYETVFLATGMRR